MKPRKPILRKKPLRRSNKPLKRTPIKRVSDKRRKDIKVYSAKRKDFLAAHPFCQATMIVLGIYEQDLVEEQGWYKDVWGRTVKCPASEEIHHVHGRTGTNYLNESTWLAISRPMHQRIHLEPSWARKMGLLA